MDLPPSVVFLYANKLSLFMFYWLVILTFEIDKRIGVMFGLLVVFGHAQFLNNIIQ